MNILKAAVFIIVVYILYYRLAKADLQAGYDQLTLNYVYFILAIALMPINWLFELWKWKIVVQPIVNSSFKTLLHSFLAGISTGMVTPNRIGNFIGRIVYYPSRHRAMLTLGTLYANLAQFIASIIPGAFVLVFFGTPILADYFPTFQNSFNITLLFFFFGGLFLLYFRLPILLVKLPAILTARYTNLLLLFKTSFSGKGFTLFLLSQSRFLIFSVQYFLLFLAFDASPSWELFTTVILIYFLTTATPSLLLGKLFIRENYALLLVMPLVNNELLILFASLGIWFINIAVPSLIGLFFVLKAKYDN